MFTEEQRIAVCQKAQIVEGLDPSMYRKDACGAWMVWDKYGVQDNMYGWEIDHIVPRSLLQEKGYMPSEIDSLINLRALQHQNNTSKGDDYPSYTAIVTAEANRNVERMQNLTVNEKLRNQLKQHFQL